MPVSHEAFALQAGWEPIQSGVTQDLNSISFICLNRGCVVGDAGVILRSGDGGINWTAQTSGVSENLYSVSYFGYTINLAVGSSGTILFTNNTGQTWIVKQTGMLGSYYSGQMITDQIGVAVGVNAVFQPFFTRTTNGWTTWQSTSYYIQHNGTMYEGRLSDVCFLNESVGVATAIIDIPVGGAIVRTTDGGVSWQTVYFSTTELYAVDFREGGNGYAVGAHGTILQSLNAGQTWVPLISGVSSVLHDVDFPSDTVGYTVGENGVILRTNNAGVTWTQQESGTTEDLLGIQSITEQTGVIVGTHGMILRTTTGGYPPDTTPPETTCTLQGTMHGGVYISNVTVLLSASDNETGVATTMYKLDNGSWDVYLNPFNVTIDGQHLLHYYSIDNAGNAEQEKVRGFTIQHPPKLAVTVKGGVGIHVTVKNLGPSDLANGTWNLTLTGGLILFGRHITGVDSINVGDEISVRTLVFGVGKIQITFSISTVETQVPGKVFLFLVRL